jgi:hypothetical protein
MKIHSTVDDLFNHVRKYCLHSALAYIGSMGYKIFNNNESIKDLPESVMNWWNLTFISKALILNSNDHKSKVFNRNELIKTLNICNNIFDERLKTATENGKTPTNNGMHDFFIRAAFQQFPFQIGTRNKLPRALILFEDLPKLIENPSIDIGNEVREIYGLSIFEIFLIGFSIFIVSKNGYLNPELITNTKIVRLKKFLTAEKVNRLISKFKINYYGIREEFKKFSGPKGLEQYEFNPLKTFPIIQTQIKGLVIPVPILILFGISDGIYYSLSEKFVDSKKNPFRIFFGKELFERYVGMLLSKKYTKNELFPEWQYGTKKSKCMTTDWIIIKKYIAIMIECKTSGISQEAKSFADFDTIQHDLGLRVVKALKQMQRLTDDVKKRKTGLDKLFGIKKFYYLVVTFDRIFLSGTPVIKNLINRELVKENINIKNYQVLSIDEVENIIPVLDTLELEYLLERKSKDPIWATYDFEIFLKDLCEKEDIKVKTINEMLKNRYEDFAKILNPNFKLKVNDNFKF